MWLLKKVFWSPQNLILDLTNNCNLRCIMCRVQALKKESASWLYPDFLTVMNCFSPRSVALGATGEPYLNKDLGSIVTYLDNKGIKSIINTNGTLIDKTDNWITKTKLFKISLDACTPKMYKLIRGTDDFEKIVSNIKELRKLKVPVRLEYVVMSVNCKQIIDFIVFAKSLDVGVFFRLFRGSKLPYNPKFDFYNIPELEKKLLNARRMAKRLKVKSNLPDLCKKLDYIKQIYSREKVTDNRKKHVCLLPWVQLFVRVDGETSPCCDLLEISNYSTGNIFKTKNVWNSDSMIKLRKIFLKKKNYEKFESCKECEFLYWKQLLKWTKLVPRWFT